MSDDLPQASLQLVGLILAALTAPVLLAPSRSRLTVALLEICPLLTLGKLIDLGEIASACKLVSGWPLFLTALSAVLHPGPRRRLSLFNFLMVAAAVSSCILVSGAEDSTKAIAIRGQMAVGTIAMMLVAQTIVDHQTLRHILLTFAIGSGIGTVIAMSSLAIDPVAAYATGYGRLQPYGCNPVQIGVLFFLAAVLGLYFCIEPHRRLPLPVAIFFTALATTGALLTVSRMAVLGIAIASTPVITRLSRRPAAIVAVVITVAALAPAAISQARGASLDHLEAVQEGGRRLDHMKNVLHEFYARPFFGLLYSENIEAHGNDFNAHNAYIDLLFLGGITYAAPLLISYIAAAVNSLRTCRPSDGKTPVTPLLQRQTTALYWLMLANGCVTYIGNYPTFSISIFQCLLAHHFLLLSERQSPLMRQNPARHVRAKSASGQSRPIPVRAKHRIRGGVVDRISTTPQGVSTHDIKVPGIVRKRTA